jgi:hypothetical protein
VGAFDEKKQKSKISCNCTFKAVKKWGNNTKLLRSDEDG